MTPIQFPPKFASYITLVPLSQHRDQHWDLTKLLKALVAQSWLILLQPHEL